MDQQKSETIYIDIFNVTSHRDFLNQIVGAIANKRSWFDRFARWLKELPNHFGPAVEWESAKPSASTMTFSLQAHKLDGEQVKQLISTTFDLLPTLGKKVFLAFDEFQSIGQLEDAGWLEATIRTKMQSQKNVSYLFSGSRHGIIHDMFNNPARPFYLRLAACEGSEIFKKENLEKYEIKTAAHVSQAVHSLVTKQILD